MSKGIYIHKVNVYVQPPSANSGIEATMSPVAEISEDMRNAASSLIESLTGERAHVITGREATEKLNSLHKLRHLIDDDADFGVVCVLLLCESRESHGKVEKKMEIAVGEPGGFNTQDGLDAAKHYFARLITKRKN